ncbi:hypothetical protein TNCV_2024551 [Trichonephila clavipes]|nr:hypothetical protein TNCV_2024551 [Trichonephila clavipes]
MNPELNLGIELDLIMNNCLKEMRWSNPYLPPIAAPDPELYSSPTGNAWITREPIGANLADEFLESENIRRMFCHYRPQPRKADLERFREQLQLPSENNKRPENNVVERVGLIVTAN